eukprot:g4306.t1
MAISCVLPFETPKSWRDKWINGQGRCIQGNHTEDTHNGDLGYAFDFKLRPGTQVLAARPGVVVAFCSHFNEGGTKRSLRPRANFVALRHDDGTYTRYVHLLRDGVLVRLGQEVAAGQAIALSGDTGFTSGPHLHFDAVDVLPQETSEVWIVHPEVVSLPSVAAIFSGPLHRDVDEFATAPLIYLSPDSLLACSSARSNGNRGAPTQHSTSSLLPLMAGHAEVVVLIDRGGASGNQTFAEAAATAADAVASMQLLPPRQVLYGGVNGGDGGVDGGGCCLCVGVIIANDRPGHEVFPMAAPVSANGTVEGVRAPYPVVMVSQESGQLLKGSLAPTSCSSHSANSPSVARTAPQFAAGWGVPTGLGQNHFSQFPDHLGGNHTGWGSGDGAGSGGGDLIVSLGAARHCPAAAASAAETSPRSYAASSPATSMSSAVSCGEVGGDSEGSRFAATLSAGDAYSWAPPVVGYPSPHVSSGYEFGSVGPPLSCYPYGSQSNAVAAAEVFRSGTRSSTAVGTSTRGAAGRGAWGQETGEWTREEMLYRAKTLPVRFKKPIW